jgi:predicted MFS family arabinose efflux permease
MAGGAVFIVASRLSPNISIPKTHVSPSKTGAIFVEMLGQSWMRRALLYGFSLSGIQFSLVLFLYFDMQSRLSIGPGIAATNLFLMQMSGSFGRVAISWFSDKHPTYRQEYVRICLLASSFGLVTFAIIPRDTASLLIFITMTWIGFFSIGWYGPWVTAIAENALPENAGAALGLAMSVNQLGIMAIPLLTGLVIGSKGDGSAAWLCLASGLVLIGVFSKAPSPKIMDRFRRVHGYLGRPRKL